MKHFRSISILVLMLLIVTASLSTPALAASADTEKGTGCFVKDANEDYFYDPECKYTTVTKYDDAGNLVTALYNDHGTLPEEAVKPSTTLHSSYYWDCGGCAFEGYYREVTTPAGKYTSNGPFPTP